MVVIVTGGRADFGLLLPVYKSLSEEGIESGFLVTGSHLSAAFGGTDSEIVSSYPGLRILERLDILQDSDSCGGMTRSLAMGLHDFSRFFERHRPECVMVLGDRYEVFAATVAAYSASIPVVHLHGGEVTYGQLDEGFRHSITKFSALHFVSADVYRQRVIQLGEQPDRVVVCGALGLDTIRDFIPSGKPDVAERLGLDPEKPWILGTMHPSTEAGSRSVDELKTVCEVLGELSEFQILFTAANADAYGREINLFLEGFCAEQENFYFIPSLGHKNYLDMAGHSEFVIGNSSSGVVEVPSLRVPTVNVGSRQQGRVLPLSVVSCEAKKEPLKNAVQEALSPGFRARSLNQISPLDKGGAAPMIASVLKKWLKSGSLGIRPPFFDLPS